MRLASQPTATRALLRKSGEPSRTRTCDPLVKSQLLYRLSYRPTKLRQSKVSSIKFQVEGSEVANSLSLWERVGVRDEVSGGNQNPSTPSSLSSNLVLTSKFESKLPAIAKELP